MEEKNMEKNIISEEDLEKAAGGLHLNKDTLKKCLIAGGVLLGAAAVGAGGYYVYNKKKDSEQANEDWESTPTGSEPDANDN